MLFVLWNVKWNKWNWRKNYGGTEDFLGSAKYKEKKDNIWKRKIFQEGKYLWMDCLMYTEGKGRNGISDLANDEKNIREGFQKQVKICFKT